MDENQIKNMKLSDTLVKTLRISPKDLIKINKDYLLVNPTDLDLVAAISKYYLRTRHSFTPKPFSRMEWLVSVLFFSVGLKLPNIANIINLPINQTKIYFFSSKEKFNKLEKIWLDAP